MRYTLKVSTEGAAPTGPLGYVAYCNPYRAGSGYDRRRGGLPIRRHDGYDLTTAGAPSTPNRPSNSLLYSRTRITCVAVANIVDGETFTIDNSERVEQFEFDRIGNGVGPGYIGVDISALTTAVEVATAVMNAINTSAPWIGFAFKTAADQHVYVANWIPGARGEAGTNDWDVEDEGFAILDWGDSVDVVPLLWGPKRGLMVIGDGTIEQRHEQQ